MKASGAGYRNPETMKPLERRRKFAGLGRVRYTVSCEICVGNCSTYVLRLKEEEEEPRTPAFQCLSSDSLKPCSCTRLSKSDDIGLT